MSGYIHVLKSLLTDPRFSRLGRVMTKYGRRKAAKEFGETLALGCLVKLWLRADSHIRDDDTLDLGADEIDEFLGIQGVTQILEPNWAQILDADHVRLPNYLAHNGIPARQAAQAAARQAKHRAKGSNGQALQDVTHPVTHERDTPSRESVEGTVTPSTLPSPAQPSLSTLLPSGAVEPRRSTGPVQEVFEHWKTEHGHPKAQLDPKRKRKITEALKHYSAEQLCQAISGYRHSAHHMGTDPKGQGVKYDDIELLLRDSSHIEAGLRFFAHPPRPPPQENASERILRKLREPEAIEHEPDEIPTFPRQ